MSLGISMYSVTYSKYVLFLYGNLFMVIFLVLCLHLLSAWLSEHICTHFCTGLCVCCLNHSLPMHLLLVTEVLNYFCGGDENLLPVARAGHVLHQAGLRKYALQDFLNKGNTKHSPVLLQNVHAICLEVLDSRLGLRFLGMTTMFIVFNLKSY